MKLKGIVLGLLISLLLSTMGCNNAATVGELTEKDQEQNQLTNLDLNLTQSEIDLLKSEGEDPESLMNNSREFLPSTEQRSAFEIGWKFFTKHYKEFWTYRRVDGKTIRTRYAYIAMKGEGTDETPAHYTTSEAMGYGMRLAVYNYKHYKNIQIKHWQQAKARDDHKRRFDRLWTTQQRFPSTTTLENGSKVKGLHSWIIPKNLDATGSTNSSATDGELDMAYALLDAHKTWGSNGSINYKAEAKIMVDAIAKYLTNKATVNGREITFLKTGDWVHWCKASPDYADKHSRPCDWMLHHFRTFIRFLEAEGYGNSDAAKTYRELLSDAEYLIGLNKWGKGLMPEFVYFGDNQMKLATPGFKVLMGEDVSYDNYSWNSCRLPWRLAMDVVQDRPNVSRAALRDIYTTTNWGSTVKNTGSEYKLDGTIVNSAFESAFAGPIVASIIGRMTYIRSSGEGRYFSMKKAKAKAEISTQFSGDPDWGYFGDAILAFSMIVLENNQNVISSPY